MKSWGTKPGAQGRTHTTHLAGATRTPCSGTPSQRALTQVIPVSVVSDVSPQWSSVMAHFWYQQMERDLALRARQTGVRVEAFPLTLDGTLSSYSSKGVGVLYLKLENHNLYPKDSLKIKYTMFKTRHVKKEYRHDNNSIYWPST